MNLKKLFSYGTTFSVCTSLCVVSLASCGTSIDDKNKINLQDDGSLYNKGNIISDVSYQTAIKNALTRSSTWDSFKDNLANEIIYEWFVNRMQSDSASGRNSTFKNNYDDWKYEIDTNYDILVQSCKTTYGANYQFYLQNKYYSVNGGSLETYKHVQMVQKVKSFFLDNVLSNQYFSMLSGEPSSIYPHIFSDATKNLSSNQINNPNNWNKIGFYASAYSGFTPIKPTSYSNIDTDWLACNPDADYAMIQQYTFDRWFETEKPFFSDAALFSYSNPNRVANGSRANIYNASFAGVSSSDLESDSPNETWPFFGGGDENSTKKFKHFIDDMDNREFNTRYSTDSASYNTNSTITIPLSDTDDSQTILLCSGREMLGGEKNALYVPYGMASGKLFSQLLSSNYNPNNNNHLSYEKIKQNLDNVDSIIFDNVAILSNFWYTNDLGWNPLTQNKNIISYLDLNACYGKVPESNVYHCPIFKYPTNDDYWWFYGTNNQSGVQYITNAIQVDDFKSTSDGLIPQPWIMELNEKGMHVQTIDGYEYIINNIDNPYDNETKMKMLKNVVKYRLLQKQCNDSAADCISATMYGDDGFLKQYFNDHLTDIVLEMSFDNANKYDITTNANDYNVFRDIESYKTNPDDIKNDCLFLNKIYSDDTQKMGDAYINICEYLKQIIAFDKFNTIYNSIVTINSTIYGYRSTQISNSKQKISDTVAIGSNGLLAPIAYAPSFTNDFMYDYVSIYNPYLLYFGDDSIYSNFLDHFNSMLVAIKDCDFIKDISNDNLTAPNRNFAFSPQIDDAKKVVSNRYWYKSLVVDLFMQKYVTNSQNLVNQIKNDAYSWYASDPSVNSLNVANLVDKCLANDDIENSFISTYITSKLFANNKNLASYTNKLDLSATEYFELLGGDDGAFDNYLNLKEIQNGETNDDVVELNLVKATIIYLMQPNSQFNCLFGNFYSNLNNLIGENENAFTGYLVRSKNYINNSISSYPINDIASESSGQNPCDVYNFNANVDNIFDQIGMAGDTNKISVDVHGSLFSTNNYWNVVKKTFDNPSGGEPIVKYLSGFLGLQTKSYARTDSDALTNEIYNNFAKLSNNTFDLSKKNTRYGDYYGCYFQFAGVKDISGKPYSFSVTYDGETINQDDFVGENLPASKLAYLISKYSTPDDLRDLAKSLSDAYYNYSYFQEIYEKKYSDQTPEQLLNHMKYDMLRLLPSKKQQTAKACSINCFKRLVNAEIHQTGTNLDKYTILCDNYYYRLMLTQINKSDIIEQNLAPSYDKDSDKWTANKNSPLTMDEFWNIFMKLACDSTIQQHCISSVVKAAFGDNKLQIYDAQLYNQFNSVWIKDYYEKPI